MRFWTQEETALLRENYLNKSSEELASILSRSEYGVLSKLGKLSEDDPVEWDKKRYLHLSAKLQRDQRKNPDKYKSERYYTEEGLKLLRENYPYKSITELAEMLGRNVVGVISKLERLANENPRVWSPQRLKVLKAQLRSKKFWTEDEIQTLRRSYQTRSLRKLAEIIGRGRYGIIRKLRELFQTEPEKWDRERICYLYTKNYREYIHSHPEQIERQREYHRRQRAGGKIFPEERRAWRVGDVVLLANTYFTRNLIELIRIFGIKTKDVHKKLRKLYEQDPDSWDIQRIGELEKEAGYMSFSKERCFAKHYAKRKFFGSRPLRRRFRIDTLIEKGLNMRAIAKREHISHQAVHQYIISRGLEDWYHNRRNSTKKRAKN